MEPGGGSRRGAWIVGGVATVIAAVVIVIVVVVLGGSGESPEETGSAGASGTAGTSGQSSEPTEPAAALPDGAYSKHSVVTVEDPVWDPAATGEYTTMYTFAFDCADLPCTGSVTGPGGATFPGTTTVEFDGTTLRFENSQVVEYACLEKFGVPYLGSVLTQVDSVSDWTVDEAAGGERPALSGPEVTTFTPLSTTGDCPMPAPGSSTRQVTLTPA
jgi:hypothetical protein